MSFPQCGFSNGSGLPALRYTQPPGLATILMMSPGQVHLVTTAENLLLLRPMRNERGEGQPVEWASSPQPSPPVEEESAPISPATELWSTFVHLILGAWLENRF